MALPSTGSISMNAIRAEYGGSPSYPISDYYRCGPYVLGSDNTASIPTSGEVSFRDYRGTSNDAPNANISFNGQEYGRGNSTGPGSSVTPGTTTGYWKRWTCRPSIINGIHYEFLWEMSLTSVDRDKVFYVQFYASDAQTGRLSSVVVSVRQSGVWYDMAPYITTRVFPPKFNSYMRFEFWDTADTSWDGIQTQEVIGNRDRLRITGIRY